MPLIRAVLDTTTMVSAIRSEHGASKAIVDLALERRSTSLIDYRLSCEYREVLLRPEHVAASHLRRHQILRLIEQMEDVSEAVIIDVPHRPLSADPDDDLVLELAISGRAGTIVSRNLRHLAAPAARFGIVTMEPRRFLFTIEQRGEHGDSR